MIFKWFKNKGSPADAARDAAVPRHIGELWMAIQETAEREDSSWSDRNVISYYHEGAEAQKDILRWLAIYQRSIDPEHEFGFPEHHPRYKGYCLVLRHWPSGSRWEAFDDSSWERIPISAPLVPPRFLPHQPGLACHFRKHVLSPLFHRCGGPAVGQVGQRPGQH